ncbi:MAG: serine hydrolase [Candidatus Omnitrophica bacterium]|nr:serine hydrolase [Candidatus Omnitrophota bacterium]
MVKGRMAARPIAVAVMAALAGAAVPCFATQTVGLTAKAAIVYDVDQGKVVYHKDMHALLPAASTVKILTALIVRQKLDLDERVTVSARAAGMAPSKAYLTAGADYAVRDLLKALLMGSANDAGAALAEAVSGTEIKFALLMNETAAAMGAKESRFLNATGLPEGKKRQYSSAYDLSLFMRKFLKYPELAEIIRTKNASITGSDGKVIHLRNHNKMLWRAPNTLVGKTGYTKRAQHCFLGVFPKGKRRLVVAIQGSQRPWADLQYLMDKRYAKK